MFPTAGMGRVYQACDQFRTLTSMPTPRRPGYTTERKPTGARLLRVLVADDNRDAADSLSMLVKLWGFDARVAYAGAAALEIASAYCPDVLLLDVAMPGLDGCQLARQLRAQLSFNDPMLIAITGYADEAHRLLCEKAGFDYFLVKPVMPSIIQELLVLEQLRLAQLREMAVV